MSENDSELARPQTKQSMADGSVVKSITVYTFVKKIPREINKPGGFFMVKIKISNWKSFYSVEPFVADADQAQKDEAQHQHRSRFGDGSNFMACGCQI